MLYPLSYEGWCALAQVGRYFARFVIVGNRGQSAISPRDFRASIRERRFEEPVETLVGAREEMPPAVALSKPPKWSVRVDRSPRNPSSI